MTPGTTVDVVCSGNTAATSTETSTHSTAAITMIPSRGAVAATAAREGGACQVVCFSDSTPSSSQDISMYRCTAPAVPAVDSTRSSAASTALSGELGLSRCTSPALPTGLTPCPPGMNSATTTTSMLSYTSYCAAPALLGAHRFKPSTSAITHSSSGLGPGSVLGGTSPRARHSMSGVGGLSTQQHSQGGSSFTLNQDRRAGHIARGSFPAHRKSSGLLVTATTNASLSAHRSHNGQRGEAGAPGRERSSHSQKLLGFAMVDVLDADSAADSSVREGSLGARSSSQPNSSQVTSRFNTDIMGMRHSTHSGAVAARASGNLTMESNAEMHSYQLPTLCLDDDRSSVVVRTIRNAMSRETDRELDRQYQWVFTLTGRTGSCMYMRWVVN